MLQIHVVENASQREILVELDGEQTVGHLKDRLRELLGSGLDRMHLGFGGMALNDHQAVSSLNAATKSAPMFSWLYQAPTEQDEAAVAKTLVVELSYLLDGGCADAGWVCCSCCAMTAICGPFECVDRFFCFFAGCDLTDCNMVQCCCWRCYCSEETGPFTKLPKFTLYVTRVKEGIASAPSKKVVEDEGEEKEEKDMIERETRLLR